MDCLMNNINKTSFIESYLSEFDEVEDIKTILKNYSYKKIFSDDILGNIESKEYKKYNAIIYDSCSDFSDDFIGTEIPKNVMLVLKLYVDGQQHHQSYGAKKEANIFNKLLSKINNYYEKGILRKIKFGIILNINYSNRFIRNLVRMNTLEILGLSYLYLDYLNHEKVYQDINVTKENVKIFGYLPSSLRLLDVNFNYIKYYCRKKSLEKYSNSINNIWLPNKIGIFKIVLNVPSNTKRIKIKYPFNTFNIIVTNIKKSKVISKKRIFLNDYYEPFDDPQTTNGSFIEENTFNLLTNKVVNDNKFVIVQSNCYKVINKNEEYDKNLFYSIRGDKNNIENINKTSVNFIKLVSNLYVSYSQSNYIKGVVKENILEHENKFDKFYWNLISDILPNVEINIKGLSCGIIIAVFKNDPYNKDLIKTYENFCDYKHEKDFYYLVLRKVFSQLH